MKRLFCLLLIILCLITTTAAWAKKTKTGLSWQVLGITRAPVKQNIDNTLESLRSTLTAPITRDEAKEYGNKARTNIERALQPYGYFTPHIDAKLQFSNNQWVWTFSINPGPVIKVINVLVTINGAGQHDPAFQDYLKKLPIKAGQLLDTSLFDDTKQNLLDIASTRGYFRAKVEHSKIIINLQHHQASYIIRFYTGPRFHFGKTTFSKSPLRDSFLRRYLRYRQGKPYDNAKLQQTQQNLSDSNYFTQVVISPDPGKAKSLAVPIRVHLVMRKRRRFTVGLGWGTDTGVRGTLGVIYHRLNSYGHKLAGHLRASEKNSSFSFSYLIPGPNPAADQFFISAGAGTINQTTGRSEGAKASLGFTTAFGSKITTWFALSYLRETYNFTNLPRIRANLLYPSTRWEYLNAPSKLHPPHGFSLILNIAGALKPILSATSFFQIRLRAKVLETFFKHTRVILRSEIGRTLIRNVLNLPLSLQLFAGGARSLRGFSYNSIGPGRNLFIASAEIQQRVIGNWYLAVFADAGNVTDGNVFNNLNVGIGPGIVWLSPIGTIEVDVANAITARKSQWRLQFSMGPEF